MSRQTSRLSYLPLGLVLALFVAPTLFVLHQALATGDFSGLTRFAATVLPTYIANSLLLAAMSTLLAVLIGVGGAFLVVFFHFPGRVFLAVALVLPLVLPPYLVAMVYRELSHLYAWTWSPVVESLGGAAVILALTLYPYVYLLVRASFRRQAVRFIEIGQSLGLSRWHIATRTLLPLATPAIGLGALLVAIEVFSDFGTVSALGVRTLTLAVHRIWFGMFDPTLAAQVAALSALFPLLLVAGYGLVTGGRGFANPGNRPRPPQPIPLTGARCWSASVLCILPVLLGFLFPLSMLLGWATEAFGRFDLTVLYDDLFNTLGLSLTVTAATLVLGTWFAISGRWTQVRVWTLGPLAVTSLNLAMPAIVLAIAMLFLTRELEPTALGEWLAGTMLLIVVAVTLRFTAFTCFSIETGLQTVSRRLDEAVACVGRSRWTVLVRVLLPQIRGPLLVGGLLVFVMASKELTLSLILQPFGYGSLALSIYEFADIDLYQLAAIHALCLVLVVIYPVLALDRWLGAR